MKILNHLKRAWLFYLLFGPTLVLAILFPDPQITVSGGLAWLYLFFLLVIGGVLIVSGVTGVEISYKSKGLIPTIKEWRETRRDRV